MRWKSEIKKTVCRQ